MVTLSSEAKGERADKKKGGTLTCCLKEDPEVNGKERPGGNGRQKEEPKGPQGTKLKGRNSRFNVVNYYASNTEIS